MKRGQGIIIIANVFFSDLRRIGRTIQKKAKIRIKHFENVGYKWICGYMLDIYAYFIIHKLISPSTIISPRPYTSLEFCYNFVSVCDFCQLCKIARTLLATNCGFKHNPCSRVASAWWRHNSTISAPSLLRGRLSKLTPPSPPHPPTPLLANFISIHPPAVREASLIPRNMVIWSSVWMILQFRDIIL